MTRDNNLDVIRVVAMTMIVCCHFFQVIGASGIAFWLNTGVQVFLLLSAFLLCQSSIRSASEGWAFLKKRYRRIMLPQWIYLASIVLALLVMGYDVKPDAVILYALGLAAFSPNGILGLGHLWYITVILICYVMFLVLHMVLPRLKYSSIQAVFLILISVAWLALFWRFSFIAYGINVLFFLLMAVYFQKRKDTKNEKMLIRLCAFPAVVLAVTTVWLSKNGLGSTLCYEAIMTTAKCLLAIVIFCGIHLFVPKIKRMQWVNYLSDISYEVYLTHQFILLFVNRTLTAAGVIGIANHIITLAASIPVIWIYAVVVNKASAFVSTGLKGRRKEAR